MNEITARTVQDIARSMEGQTQQQKVDALLHVFQDFSQDEQKAMVPKFNSSVGQPGNATRDSIWLIIVWAFVLVLGGSAIVLGLAVFWETKANATYFAKIETIVTVFTSVLAFLSGLLAPSPIKGGGADGSG